MKIKGLDGKEYTWSIERYINNNRNVVSEPHKLTRQLLKELFPLDRVLEELTLPGSGKFVLTADFYIPRQYLMIEIHGEQHYKFVPFFHNTKQNFLLAQANDRRKKEWCDINDITLLVLDSRNSVDEWKRQIEEC